MNGYSTGGIAIVVVLVAAAVTAIVVGRNRAQAPPNTTHVVLIGASIGQGWHLEQWPERSRAPGFSAEAVAAWQFDKSQALEDVLQRPKRKFSLTRTYLRSLWSPPRRPQLLILKECSSYFPSDLEADKRVFQQWVDQARAASVKVVVATVVPVTRARSERDPGKQQGLSQFNEWIRSYAARERIPLLDLDAALREGGPGSFLREDFDKGDGSHLNGDAYAVLDGTLRASLCGSESGAGCASNVTMQAAR